ncbi:hypothetical protein L2E82_42126 [Cichorium intybus]|uniref:Uncharacterized protein n=1 Tax=Cichorium intybus TaxID=13427 RepID=A0ACB8ZLU7_CICIN|nr:hypothetical protein L2E82_42126 [Cichorium intybus]
MEDTKSASCPPTIPVSVPPIPRPEKGPDFKSPVNLPTMTVEIAPPPKDMLQNPPPVAQVPTSMPQVPPSVPQPPSIILPGPVASPPNKLPMASPPTNPTLPTPPPSLPRAMGSLDHKIQTVEELLQESCKSCSHKRNLYELELMDAKVNAAQQAAESSCV